MVVIEEEVVVVVVVFVVVVSKAHMLYMTMCMVRKRFLNLLYFYSTTIVVPSTFH